MRAGHTTYTHQSGRKRASIASAHSSTCGGGSTARRPSPTLTRLPWAASPA
jgi:hypothetical protein